MAARSAEIVWQPVTDYSISFPGDRAEAAPAINPFDHFTHFGTDFGWMGPGQRRLDARAGAIRTQADGEWTGAWHSLAGLATETQRVFDPTGLGGPAEVRAGVVAVTVDARALLAMPKAAGFLPHFTRCDDRGQPVIHPGTEFSTADTAIALHALRLAATVLELPDVADAVAALVADLDFDGVSDAEGWIGHGFHQDGHTLLASQWRELIRQLEKAGLLFPQGLPENVEIGLRRHNPMQGSLNAGFESLAAYHGWRRGGGGLNVIDEASRRDPMLRAGIRRFWPE